MTAPDAPNLPIRGGSWYNDRDPYHRANVQHHTSKTGPSIGFRTFRPSRIPSSVTTLGSVTHNRVQ